MLTRAEVDVVQSVKTGPVDTTGRGVAVIGLTSRIVSFPKVGWIHVLIYLGHTVAPREAGQVSILPSNVEGSIPAIGQWDRMEDATVGRFDSVAQRRSGLGQRPIR